MNIIKSDTKFFSIALPTYEMHGRGVEFLAFSFDILNKQTFKDFEVVISDNSLNNDIKNLCDKWNKKLKIRYFRNPATEKTATTNSNNALKNCTGKWIKILFQDDFLYGNDALENLHNHIKNNPDKIWFATACEHSKDGQNMEREHFPKWSKKLYLGKNTISSPSVITIKNTNDKLLFNKDFTWLMDVEYYKRMYDLYGEPSYLLKINVVNRLWGNSTNNTLSDEVKEQEVRAMRGKYKYSNFNNMFIKIKNMTNKLFSL